MKKPKVLVVDDEKLLVKSTCMALTFNNFETEGALSGEEALRKAESSNPDIIMLDIMMPGMDGWEVLEKIKLNKKLIKIPVIIFTAKEPTSLPALVNSRAFQDHNKAVAKAASSPIMIFPVAIGSAN